MGRAIRAGLDRCRICSGVAATSDRFCEDCAGCIDRGDREGLADRAAVHLVARFKPIGKDMDGLRQAAMRGQARFFASGESAATLR